MVCPPRAHNTPSDTSGWPIPPNKINDLQECSSSFPPGKGQACINTKHNPSTDTTKNNISLNDSCFNVSPNSHCVEDSKCVMNGDGYSAMCLPYCNQVVKVSCCNDASGCEDCDLIPDDGICSNNHTINKNTIWMRINNINYGCFYTGSEGKLWYDDGAACSKALCDNTSNGIWYEGSNYEECMNSGHCNRHTNVIHIAANIDSYFDKINGDNRYRLINDLTISTGNCNDTVSIGDYKHTYILTSIKPSTFDCAKFKEWNDCSMSQCEENCLKVNNKNKEICKDFCKPVNFNKINDLNLDESERTINSSTTNFAFGAATACMVNGQEFNQLLTGYSKDAEGKFHYVSEPEKFDGKYWVGVATPSWIQSPFNTNKPGGPAEGGSTISYKYGRHFTSNCSMGTGGCGTCWNLTQNDTGKSINAVVIDTCEDANGYGNNYNWCVAQRPDINPSNFIENPDGGTYSGHFPPFYKQLPFSSTNTLNSDDRIYWNAPDCWTKDSSGQDLFICKNMAFQPTHFDVAIQGLSESATEKMGVWSNTINPNVTAKRIKCPDSLKKELIKHSGNKSGSTAKTSEYCPGHDDSVYWSIHNKSGYWPPE
jgi:hypothetical protein